MLERLVASIVASYLGKYILNLDKEQVKVSLWGGDVVLKNLLIKPTALLGLGLPIGLLSGTVGVLRISIPWSHLASQSIKIEISDVNIVIAPKDQCNITEEDEAVLDYEEKLERLATFEAMRHEEEAVDKAADAKDEGFMFRLKTSMLKNVQLSTRDINVEYHHLYRESVRQVRLKLEAILLNSTDKDWNVKFVSSQEQFHYKLIEVLGISLYVDVSSEQGSSLCHPIDITIQARHQPVPIDATSPEWLLKTVVAAAQFTLSREQWDTFWNCLRYFEDLQLRSLRQKPPTVSVTKDPAQWWRFALSSILGIIRKRNKRGRMSWVEYRQLKLKLNEYADLHKRTQKVDWLPQLSGSDEVRYRELERELPIEVLCRGRRLAYSQLKLEGEQYNILVQEGKTGKKKATGWWAWVTGNAVPEGEEEEDVQKMWELIDADRWNEEQRSIMAKEFGLDESANAPLVIEATNKVQLDLHLAAVSMSLLDYNFFSFAQFFATQVKVIFSLKNKIRKLNVTLQRYGIVDKSSNRSVLHPLDEAAEENIKLAVVISDVVDVNVEVKQNNLTLCVPWLQHCVAFWGRRRALIDDAAAPKQTILDDRVKLQKWYEKNKPVEIFVRIRRQDITIIDCSQECTIIIHELIFAHSKDEAVKARNLLTTGSLPQSAWSRCFSIHTKLSIDVKYDDVSRRPIMKIVPFAIEIKTSIVKSNEDLPMVKVNCQAQVPLALHGSVYDYFVLMSAVSVVMELLNNAAGKRNNKKQGETKTSFYLPTRGPFPQFLHDNESFLEVLRLNPFTQRQYETNRRQQHAHIDVVLGYVRIYHESRPSMLFALLELKEDEFDVDVDSTAVCICVMQGGVNHRWRLRQSEAQEVLGKYGIEVIPSIPQQREAIVEFLAKTKDEEVAAEVWEAFEAIISISRTVPCTSVLFECGSTAEAVSLRDCLVAHAIPRVSAPQGKIVSSQNNVFRDREFYHLEISAPQLVLGIIDDDGGVVELIDHKVLMQLDVKLISTSLALLQQGLQVKHSDALQRSLLCIEGNTQFIFQTGLGPKMKLLCDAMATIELNFKLVRAIELIWDLLNVLLMKHLTAQICTSMPWGFESSFVLLPDTVSFEVVITKGLQGCLCYDDDVNSPAMKIGSSKMELRWSSGYSTNKTSLLLFSPTLDICVDGLPPSKRTLRPIREATTPLLLLEYNIVYKPVGLSESAWKCFPSECGFNYTHFITLVIRSCELCYTQHRLWYILEYFTHGHLARLGSLGWRPKVVLPVKPEETLTAPRVFSFALMHQNIELREASLVLPHDDEEGIRLRGFCKRMSLVSVLKDSVLSEVQNGFNMTMDGLELSYDNQKIISTSGIALSLDFTLASLSNQLPESIMVMSASDFFVRGKEDAYVTLLRWVHYCFVKPWKGVYPVVAHPKNPIPRLRNGPHTTARWEFRFKLLDINMQSVKSMCTVQLEMMLTVLTWQTDGSFLLDLKSQTVHAWDLATLVNTGKKTTYVKSPKEIISRTFRILRLKSSNNVDGLQLRNGWRMRESKTAFLSCIVGACEVSVAPTNLLDLRDLFLSLKMRNAIGPIFKWNDYIVGADPPKPKTEQNEWNSTQTVDIRSITLTFFLEASLQGKKVLHLSLHDVGYKYLFEACSAGKQSADLLQLSLRTAVCGLINSDNSLSQIIVPKVKSTKGLLCCNFSSPQGWEAELGHVWIIVPHDEQLKFLRDIVTHPRLTLLGKLALFREERDMPRIIPRRVQWKPSENLNVTLINPCIVITERVDTSRGVVLSLGTVCCRTTVVEEQDTKLNFFLELAHANASSLHQSGHYIVQPLTTSIAGIYAVNGNIDASASIGSLYIDVAQEYYESLLHACVHYLIDDDTSIVERQAQSYSPKKEKPGKEVPQVSQPKEPSDITQKYFVKWESTYLRVEGKSHAVHLSTGELTAAINLSASESRIGGELNTLECGVEGERPFLCLFSESNDPITVSQLSLGSNSTLSGNLGLMSLYLNQESVLAAISSIYEPYQRIYGQKTYSVEVLEIDDDWSLQDRLVLSYRRIMRIKSSKKNFITINCHHKEVHFVSARASSPVLQLDAGLTLKIINGKIHLYDHPLEHYVAAGNGSYIVIGNEENEVFRSSVVREQSKSMSTADSESVISLRAGLEIKLPDSKDSRMKRVLVLKVDMGVEFLVKQMLGEKTESGRFTINQLVADCRLADDPQGHAEYSSLISQWAASVSLDGGTVPGTSIFVRTVDVLSTEEVQIRIRYGDLKLVLGALHRARKALGEVGTRVGADVETDETVSDVASGSTSLTITTQIHRVGITLLDDRSGQVDIPLVYVDLSSITTPTFEMHDNETAIHLNMCIKADYYNQEGGCWSILLDAVFLDLVSKLLPNTNLEDVQRRRGETKTGVRFRLIHFHFTPQAAAIATRIRELLASLNTTEDKDSTTQQFFMFSVKQRVVPEVTMSIESESGVDAVPMTVKNDSEVAFNFPRIHGKEVHITKQNIRIQLLGQEIVANVGRTGVSYLSSINQCAVAETQLEEGQKRFLLRTNATFQNKLPFPVELSGVGIISPSANFVVPFDSMRQRCIMKPLTKNASRSVALGIPYEAVQYLFDQSYLCTSPLISEDTPQKAVYFVARFAPRTVLSTTPLRLDGKCIFEAPFSIINHTGTSIQVGIYCKAHVETKEGSVTKRVLKFGKSSHFIHVTTASADPEGEILVTEVDPLQNVYMDVLLTQPTGEVLSRIGGGTLPSLIHCRNKKSRVPHIFIWDQAGRPLCISIEYCDRSVVLSCAFWLVNQTLHYLQISDAKPGKDIQECAGLGEGVPPVDRPFLLNSDKHVVQKEKAAIYVRVGRHSHRGLLMWSDWSAKLYMNEIGALFVANMGEAMEVVTLSYSVELVGGVYKETKVIKFTPRWIIINRCPRALMVSHSVRDELESGETLVTLPPHRSKTFDVARSADANTIAIRYCEDDDVSEPQWSEEFCIDRFAEYSLNMVFKHRADKQQEFTVVRVSCYSRSSILYVTVERCNNPPYFIENRTVCVLSVKQKLTARELIVYPKTTRGFVMEETTLEPILVISARESHVQASSAAQRTLNLDPITVSRKPYMLAQELILPGGIILYIRTRAKSSSYAISITTDRDIDKVRLRPHHQQSFKLQIDGFHVSAGKTKDIMLFSIVGPRGLPGFMLSFSQTKGMHEYDEQTIEAKIGTLQIDDERKNAVKEVVFQSTLDRTSDIMLTRRLDRTTPMIQICRCEITIQPMRIHLEDSFLYECLHLIEAFKVAVGQQGTTELYRFENTPWIKEIDKSLVDESSHLFRVVFVERLLIEQLVLSISLYRGTDSSKDPIREQLGMLAVLVRSVQDARFDWRRIENVDLCDKLWLLFTFLSNYYQLELQQQLLNVVHVAGLDSMRNIVTDLLEGYFSSSVNRIDRTQVMLRRRQVDSRLEQVDDDLREWENLESTVTPCSPAVFETCRCKWIEKRKQKGTLNKAEITIPELAHHTNWNEFIEMVNFQELRDFGGYALCHAVRSRSLTKAPAPSLCQRCDEMEKLRTERILSNAMSPLPHPSSGMLQWFEFVHHVAWHEFISICSENELQRFATAVKDAIIGAAYNVVRLEGELLWAVRE